MVLSALSAQIVAELGFKQSFPRWPPFSYIAGQAHAFLAATPTLALTYKEAHPLLLVYSKHLASLICTFAHCVCTDYPL